MQYEGTHTIAGVVQSVVVGVLLGFTGCTSAFATRPALVFPPQHAMETGDYRQFRADNQERLEICSEEPAPPPVRLHRHKHAIPQRQEMEPLACDEPLFNLGFVYALPESPYRDRQLALRYFRALAEISPESPWAFQARAWAMVLQEQEDMEEDRRKLQNDLQRTRASLRSREKTVQTLQNQLKRLRELDIQMEKRQRELLR